MIFSKIGNVNISPAIPVLIRNIPSAVCYNSRKGGVSVKVLVDADACPVVNIAVDMCRRYKVGCYLFCDTSHSIRKPGALTIIVDRGMDSADFALVQSIVPKDIVITQDYGLASMCLARGAFVLHHDGWEYTAENIDALLMQRHLSAKARAAGVRTKGPKRRDRTKELAFIVAMDRLLQKSIHG